MTNKNGDGSRLSIGFPVFNGEAHLHRRIPQVLRQTFDDFELFISDNGSTDRTREICCQYAARDPRIRVLANDVNRGAFWNFRNVLRSATSEYFVWCAADDDWSPRFLQLCIEALDRMPEMAACFTRFHITSVRFPFLRRSRLPLMSFMWHSDPSVRVSSYLGESLSTQKANFVYGVWHRRMALDAMDAVGNPDPRLTYSGGDIAMIAYTLARAPVYQLDEVLFGKASKWFPSGSPLDELLDRLLTAVRYHEKPTSESLRQAARDYRNIMRGALLAAGMSDPGVEQLLSADAQLERWKNSNVS